jgi:cytosine/creatinine deaminase
VSFSIARTPRWVAADARVIGADATRDAQGFGRVDLMIDGGRIGAIASTGAADFGDAPRLPLAGRIVLPAFVDAHTHLDKGHIWRRAPNRTGLFPHASRQGPYLAARAQPHRPVSRRDPDRRRRPRRQLGR